MPRTHGTDMLLPSAAWLAVWFYRRRKADPTAPLDLLVACAAEAWARRREHAAWQAVIVWTLVFAVASIISGGLGSPKPQTRVPEPLETERGKDGAQPWTRPLLLPARTTHTRLFPKRHAFSYSYFMVGVPVGWSGRAEGGLLAVDARRRRRRAPLEVRAADHLHRTVAARTLRDKLDHYLRGEGLDPASYPLAFLVTAPRVLGYAFNPVSFWHLYAADRRLRAMVLEVNNTFDERRMYFLAREAAKPGADGQEAVFSSAWAKDFHVSPFNDRAGSYSLAAKHLDFENLGAEAWLSNIITLLAADGKAKLVARIATTEAPIDPSEMSLLQGIRLAAQFGWVGFVTFPRIIKEAAKLYFARGLPVWFKPEVARGSVGRRATADECTIERIFRQYMACAVEGYNGSPVRLAYRPAQGLDAVEEQYLLESTSGDEVKPPSTTLHILTPAFYTRLAHYSSVEDALRSEGLCGEMKNRTICIEGDDVLIHVLSQYQKRLQSHLVDSKSTLEKTRWALLARLRCPAAAGSYPDDPPAEKKSTSTGGQSSLDRYVAMGLPDDIQHDARAYRRLVTAQFFAQRFVGGITLLVDALDVSLRVGLAVLVAHTYARGTDARATAQLQALLMAVASPLNLYALLKGL